MGDMTFGQLATAVAVALLLLGAYNTVMTAIKNHREEKKLKNSPIESLKQRVDAHDGMLKRDKERIDAMDEENKIMMRGIMALLSHEINGNSTDKLKASLSEINDYLIKRK